MLPDPADDCTQAEADKTCDERGGSDKSEEEPEAADKIVAVYLRGEVLPRDWCGAEEADQESAISD